MRLKKRVDLKKYLLLSTLVTAPLLLFLKEKDEFIGFFIVFISILINQLMLVYALMELLSKKNVESPGNVDKTKVILLLIGKIIILFGGISLGVHFMEKKVLIAVANYIALIFILIYSVRAKDR